MKMSRSATSMSVAAALCPAGMAAYDEGKDKVQIPSDARDRGTVFHRVVEGIQAALMAQRDEDDPVAPVEELVREALQQAVASAEIEALVQTWVDAGWTLLPERVWIEWKLAVDERWTVVPFGSARYRGVLDRAEIEEREVGEYGETELMLVVTDWKSGWSDFTGAQGALYPLLADAWLASEEAGDLGERIQKIAIRKWSPVAKPAMRETVYERTEAALAPLRATVEAAARVEDRVRIQIERERASGSPLSERPSARCVWCDRKDACATFKGLTDAGWTPLGLAPESDAAFVDRYEALKAAASDAESALKKHTKDGGAIVGSFNAWGWMDKSRNKGKAPQFWQDVLEQEIWRYGEGADGGVLLGTEARNNLALRLAQLIGAPVTAVKSTATKLFPRDKPGQASQLAIWLEAKISRTFGKVGIGNDEDEGDE